MHEERFPKIIAQRPSAEMEERAVLGTAEGLIAEGFPGTEGRARVEIVDVVRRVHAETCGATTNSTLRPHRSHALRCARRDRAPACRRRRERARSARERGGR
jgi:hypothetical protein